MDLMDINVIPILNVPTLFAPWGHSNVYFFATKVL